MNVEMERSLLAVFRQNRQSGVRDDHFFEENPWRRSPVILTVDDLLVGTGVELWTFTFWRHIDFHPVNGDEAYDRRLVEQRSQIHVETEFLHREHWRKIATALVAQQHAVTFDTNTNTPAAFEQHLHRREFRHPHTNGSQFDVAVEPALQVGNRLRADIRLETIGEDITGHRQRDEHRHRDGPDADEPFLPSSCQRVGTCCRGCAKRNRSWASSSTTSPNGVAMSRSLRQ